MTVTTDRGWSWVILVASFGCSFLMFGTLAGGGVLYVAILDLIEGSTRSEVTWILFLMQICLNVMGPIAGYLGQRFSYRRVVIIGGFIATVGLFTCYFAKSVEHLFASFGLVYGLGLGLVVTPHIVVVNLAFAKYRALANGIFTAGASLGSFAVPPTLEYLIETYGLRGLFIIWSGAILHIVLFGAVYRQAKPVPKKINDIQIDYVQNYQKVKLSDDTCVVQPRRTKRRLSWLSFLADRHFWMVALGWSGTTFGISCFAVIIVDFATSQNDDISRAEATFLVSFWAIGDLIGRLASGFILETKFIKLKHFYILSMIFSSLTATALQFLSSYKALAICSVFFGLALGAAFVQHSLLLIETLGIETFQRAMGYLGVSAGMNLVGLTLLVGFLRDATQSHHCNFTLMGFMLLLPAVLWVFEISYYNLCKSKLERTMSTKYDSVTHPHINEI